MDDVAEQLAIIEHRYFGKPKPIPLAKQPAEIAARRDEAIRQMYLAATSDDPRVQAAARAQFAIAQIGELADGSMTRMKVSRNDSCVCGSGSKFKHCCGRGD